MLFKGSDHLLLVGEVNLNLIVEAGFIFVSNILRRVYLDFFAEIATAIEQPELN